MKQHIKNLDTFRAIAAIVVMIGHIELFRQNNWGSSLFNIVPSGHTAVMMFFVISGFLITFLLAKEKEKYGTISLKDFYLRRVLRIYPLYYLILLLSSLFFLPPPQLQGNCICGCDIAKHIARHRMRLERQSTDLVNRRGESVLHLFPINYVVCAE